MARIWLAHTSTETSPPSGQLSFYAKSDDNFYLKTSQGDEYQIVTNNTPGIGGYEVEQIVITGAQAIAKTVELISAPTNPDKTLLFISGGGAAFFGIDFTVVGNLVQWDTLALDGLLEAGDRIQVVYF